MQQTKPSSLKLKVVNGVFWNVIELVINRGFAFAIKLVLAKILFPEQFGLIGMATVFASFVQVFNDIGIGAALVQRKQEDLQEIHFHTAFWTGIVWSIGIYLIMAFGVAPLAASFYREPILRDIVPVMSLGILSGPVNLVHNAQLTREMQFKKLAFISGASTIFSGLLALGLALAGAGVWSLVFNSVATFVIAMPLYFGATKWVPKLQWQRAAFNDIFGFGVYTTGTNLFNNLISKLDYLLIGKLLSASALGVYTLAFVLTDTFRSQIMHMVNKVMYPIYGQKQDDISLVRKFYLKTVRYNSLCIYPIMVFFIVLGEPFVLGFFEAKWSESVIPLKVLALSVMIHMLVSSHGSLIRGLGQPRLEMKLQFFKALFLYVPLISFGVYYYGILGAAWAFVGTKTIEVILAQYYLKKLVGITVKDLMKTITPPLWAAVAAATVTYLLLYMEINYIVAAVSLVFSYSAVIWLLMGAELLLQFKEVNKKSKSGRDETFKKAVQVP
ncbi:lipopolysaccharide biosynthesis protein [Pontibacter anaerobius]|uniref:Lipopolysaccharide biosynthesis protein n=1 Tax=Pontibacter anaerobius TaxID=2993940 RepID=A0ABT3RFC9_9BACT|nr:lipopolysaccharide biosynthesis protein [Pontibacter anaerobius]MCX2739945.1 lipopolysaccharide biosynthesis protein [Pontibacter anaerobius]